MGQTVKSPHERALREMEEVELLAEVAERYSVPLGAGTASAPGSKGEDQGLSFTRFHPAEAFSEVRSVRLLV